MIAYRILSPNDISPAMFADFQRRREPCDCQIECKVSVE